MANDKRNFTSSAVASAAGTVQRLYWAHSVETVDVKQLMDGVWFMNAHNINDMQRVSLIGGFSTIYLEIVTV